MENLMNLYRKERVTDYFKQYAHCQIDIAHRIKEYIEPDNVFTPEDLNESTKNKFLRNEITSAIEDIFDELNIDIPSSRGHDELLEEAVKFAKVLLDDYYVKHRAELMKEREELIDRLKKLNDELGFRN